MHRVHERRRTCLVFRSGSLTAPFKCRIDEVACTRIATEINRRAVGMNVRQKAQSLPSGDEQRNDGCSPPHGIVFKTVSRPVSSSSLHATISFVYVPM